VGDIKGEDGARAEQSREVEMDHGVMWTATTVRTHGD
jgi:hypothetical protein